MATDNLTPLSIKTKTAGDVSVKIDQTTPGTTNAVAVTSALPAGTNLVGKVGIDQTTPGTTNGVVVTSALPAGSNVIGHVIADASSAIIGKVGIDQSTPGTTNAVQITGPGTSNANPLYISEGAAGTIKNSGQLTSLALPINSNATISTSPITTGKTATIQHVTASSSIPIKVEIQTVNNSNVATTVVTMFTSSANPIADWKPNVPGELAGAPSADGTNNKLSLKITNMDNTNAADVYGYIAYLEN